MSQFQYLNKIPHLMFGLAAIAGTTVISAPEAKARGATEIVRCPLTMAKRTITNDLPSGWWTTPIASRLTDLRIANIGGRTTLICKYGEAGSIQRKAPRGKRCSVIEPRKYFYCRGAGGGSNGSSNPGTYKTGPITLRQTFTADLDSGRTAAGARSDIWFQAETSTRLFITPRNGAKISVGDRSNRGYSGCRTARYSTNKYPLRLLPVGSYICVKTNAGRISQFRINGISSGSPKTLRIGYTTWNR